MASSYSKKRNTANSLEYSLDINLTHYLELLTKNKSSVENKTIFSNQSSLIGKKGVAVKGTIYETLIEKYNISNITILDSYEEAQKALNNHSIDYFICPKRMIGEIIQMRTETLTYIDDTEGYKEFRPAVVLKNNEESKRLSNLVLAQIRESTKITSFKDLYDGWIGVDKGLKYVNLTQNESANTTANYLMNFNQEPYAYIDNKTKQKTGMLLQVAQMMSGTFSIKNNFLEANSQKDYIPSIKNGTANITTGYFLYSELNDSELIVINTTIPSDTSLIIRYENSEDSNDWSIFNSVEDFNGEVIGTVSQYQQEDTVKANIKKCFSDSTIETNNSVNNLFSSLLREDYEGIVVDENAVPYYVANSDRIDCYNDTLFNNSYGILFKSADVKNDFNDFLNKSFDKDKRANLFNSWKNADSGKTVEFNNKGNKPLFVAFEQERPMCYMENLKYKGYEFALLEEFALEKGYNIIVNYSSIGYSEMADVILGYQNITGEKAGNYYFSDSILTSRSILVVRKDGKRENLPLTALDQNYNKKDGNALDIPIKIGNQEAISKCILPSKFNSDVITLSCSASGLTRLRNLADEGIEFGETTDRIDLLYSSIKADNLMKANKLFGENIVNISSFNETGESSSHPRSIHIKNSSGLSKGGIIGIAIPSVAAAAAVLGIAMAMKGNNPASTAAAGAGNVNSSVSGLSIPIQDVNAIPNNGNNIVQVSQTSPA